MEKILMAMFRWFQQEKSLLLLGSGIGFIVLVGLDWNGLLPFELSWFVFCTILGFLAALYRPAWVFLVLLVWLPLETTLLAPAVLGGGWRPYQWLTLLLALALVIRKLTSTLPGEWFRFHWLDLILGCIPLAAFLTALFSHTSLSLRLSMILGVYYLLYLVARFFWRSIREIQSAIPFFLLGAGLSMGVGLLQVVLFRWQLDAHMVMVGRPNATFTEPDWYGVFLLIVLAVLLVLVKKSRDESSESAQASPTKHLYWFSIALLFGTVLSLILTVSRSAWLGAGVMMLLFLFFVCIPLFEEKGKLYWREGVFFGNLAVAIIGAALLFTIGFGLTRFDLGARAISTATGDQKITLACVDNRILPERIVSVDDLAPLGCQHITLEERALREEEGLIIREILRPDPNVEIRKHIYAVSIEALRDHPLLGVGWGTIGDRLGRDERGESFNASNVFLEIWLGSGFLGIVAFILFILGSLFLSFRYTQQNPQWRYTFFFVSLGWLGLLVFDLFNSGFLLGWVWVFFAIIPLGRNIQETYAHHRN